MRRLLAAARDVYDARARYVADIARTTGLSPEGVELGFESLERDASEEELSALVAAAGDVERVHVILSANVFVAPLRAMALARAAAASVTVRPSRRDPVLARALIEAAKDPALGLVEERAVEGIDAGEVHVYGRDETIAAVRAVARPGVVVRGHGAGMGVAVVTAAAEVGSAAQALVADVAAFDQRGCLSPRLVVVEGDEARARAFAGAMHESLEQWGARVPRGSLTDDERREATAWHDTLAFAGEVLAGESHLVALRSLASSRSPLLLVPPPGRHLLVTPAPSLEAGFHALAPLGRHIVAVGTDDPGRVRSFAPAHARTSRLGRMQRPPLDGPVDRRGHDSRDL